MLGAIEDLRLIVEEASALRPHLTSRLEKAAFLVLLRSVEQLDQSAWTVGSEDGLRNYVVKGDDCECSDYFRHGRGHFCKHRLAVIFYQELQDRRDACNAAGRGERREVPRRKLEAKWR